MKVSKATDKDISRFYGVKMPFPWEGIVGKEGDLIVGIGGVFVQSDGTLMGFMDLTRKTRKPMVFRYVIMYLRELRRRGIDAVSVSCDTSFNRAEAFLIRLGFTATDYVDDGRRIWTWQA